MVDEETLRKKGFTSDAAKRSLLALWRVFDRLSPQGQEKEDGDIKTIRQFLNAGTELLPDALPTDTEVEERR